MADFAWLWRSHERSDVRLRITLAGANSGADRAPAAKRRRAEQQADQEAAPAGPACLGELPAHAIVLEEASGWARAMLANPEWREAQQGELVIEVEDKAQAAAAAKVLEVIYHAADSSTRLEGLSQQELLQVLLMADRLQAARAQAAVARALAAKPLEWATVCSIYSMPEGLAASGAFRPVFAAAADALQQLAGDIEAAVADEHCWRQLMSLPLRALVALLSDKRTRAAVEDSVFHAASAWLISKRWQQQEQGGSGGGSKSAVGGGGDGVGGGGGGGDKGSGRDSGGNIEVSGGRGGGGGGRDDGSGGSGSGGGYDGSGEASGGGGGSSMDEDEAALAACIRAPQLSPGFLHAVASQCAWYTRHASAADLHIASLQKMGPSDQRWLTNHPAFAAHPAWGLPARPASAVTHTLIEFKLEFDTLRRLHEAAQLGAPATECYAASEAKTYCGLGWRLRIAAARCANAGNGSTAVEWFITSDVLSLKGSGPRVLQPLSSGLVAMTLYLHNPPGAAVCLEERRVFTSAAAWARLPGRVSPQVEFDEVTWRAAGLVGDDGMMRLVAELKLAQPGASRLQYMGPGHGFRLV